MLGPHFDAECGVCRAKPDVTCSYHVHSAPNASTCTPAATLYKVPDRLCLKKTYRVLPNGSLAEEKCTHHALPQSQAIGTFPQQTGNPALYRGDHCTQRFVTMTRSDYSDYGHPCCFWTSPYQCCNGHTDKMLQGLLNGVQGVKNPSIGATAF